MARISLDPPKTLSYRIGTRFSRRRYGVMLDPGAAMAHNMKVGRSYALFELGVERWRSLDTRPEGPRGHGGGRVDRLHLVPGLRLLGGHDGVDVPADKILAVPDWRDSGHVHRRWSGSCLSTPRR